MASLFSIPRLEAGNRFGNAFALSQNLSGMQEQSNSEQRARNIESRRARSIINATRPNHGGIASNIQVASGSNLSRQPAQTIGPRRETPFEIEQRRRAEKRSRPNGFLLRKMEQARERFQIGRGGIGGGGLTANFGGNQNTSARDNFLRGILSGGAAQSAPIADNSAALLGQAQDISAARMKGALSSLSSSLGLRPNSARFASLKNRFSTERSLADQSSARDIGLRLADRQTQNRQFNAQQANQFRGQQISAASLLGR